MEAIKPITATGAETGANGLIIILGERRVTIPWDRCSERLAGASDLERKTMQLSPGGYGIHWPLIDEDLSINGLVQR